MNFMSVVARSAFLLSMIVFHPVHADVGKLTIDGVELPGNLINGMYKGNDWCPPTSDIRYRQRLINTALIVFAGRKGNFELNTGEKKRIAEATSELQRAESLGNRKAIDKAAWGLFWQEGNEYGSYLYTSVSDLFSRQEILEEYKRLIKIKDPRLTNVVTVKYIALTLPDSERAQRAIDLFNSGKSVAEVTSAIDEYQVFPHVKDKWFIAEKLTGFSGDARRLKSGMAVLATEGQMWYGSDEQFVLYFDEVLKRSRLRPFTEYNNNDDYGYDITRYDLWDGVHKARRIERWENADIREDGEPVELLEVLPECP